MNMLNYLMKNAVHTPCAYKGFQGVTKYNDEAIAYRLSRPYKNYSHVVVTTERNGENDPGRRVVLAVVGEGRFVKLFSIAGHDGQLTDKHMLKMIGYEAVGYRH